MLSHTTGLVPYAYDNLVEANQQLPEIISRLDEVLEARKYLQEAATSLILFTILYLSLAAVWIFVLDRKIRNGPEEIDLKKDGTEHGFQDASSERQHARLSQS